MKNQSLTISGIVALVLIQALERAGVSVGYEEVDTFLMVGGQIVAVVVTYAGRFRQGDITWYGKKKAPMVK